MVKKKITYTIEIGRNGYSPDQIARITWGDLQAMMRNDGVDDEDEICVHCASDCASYYSIKDVYFKYYETEDEDC